MIKQKMIYAVLVLLFAMNCTALAQAFQPYKSNIIAYHGYLFPIVPGTDAWKQMDYTQRVASLQLPADTLRDISTARLLETCLYYPFNIDIFAFDDQLRSFGRIKEQFNGYAELYQRADFIQQLISLYNTRDVAFVNQIEGDYDKGLYSFDYHIMEFMFTDAVLMASDSQTVQIAATLMNKKEQKTKYNVYGSANHKIVDFVIEKCNEHTTK